MTDSKKEVLGALDEARGFFELMQRNIDAYCARICAVCGNTYGSHRAGPPEFVDQCPQNEGRMDWDEEHPTFFKEKDQ